MRIELTDPAPTYYYAAGASGAMDGSLASPFPHPQNIYDWLREKVDTCGKVVQALQVPGAVCTYNQPFLMQGANSLTGGGSLQLTGDVTNPGNAKFHTTDVECFNISNKACVSLAGFKVETVLGPAGWAASGVSANLDAAAYINGPMEYGQCAGHHNLAIDNGLINFTTEFHNYLISGGAWSHWGAFNGKVVCVSMNDLLAGAIKLINNPWFAWGFGYADMNGILSVAANKFTGNTSVASSHKHLIKRGGKLDSGGADKTLYLPGAMAGTIDADGRWY